MKTKKALAIILTFVISFGILTIAFADETAEVPEGYTPIYTAEDLYNIRNDLDGKFILMNDIDLSVYENWKPIGSSETPFTGELDGNGYFVKNMTIVSECESEETDLGLFGVAQDTVLNKILIDGGKITAKYTDNSKADSLFVGILAGKVVGEDYAKTTNCFSNGSININGCADISSSGLIGAAIKDNYVGLCVNYADIIINTQDYRQKIFVGGILGKASYDVDLYEESFFNIRKSANYGDISINNAICDEDTQIYIGGISSYQITGNTLAECYNRGNISVKTQEGTLVIGGIMGEAIAKVEKSYNSGIFDVISDDNDKVSGICNIKTPYLYTPEGPTMEQDYIVYNCYYSNENLMPCNQDVDLNFKWYKNIVYLSNTEMKIQDFFAEFDFENVWEMEEDGYPVLQNQPVLPENIPERPTTTESTTEPTTEEEPEFPCGGVIENVDIKILYAPLRSRIVIGNAEPILTGMVLKVTYSDGESEILTVKQNGNEYYADEFEVWFPYFDYNFDPFFISYGIVSLPLSVSDEYKLVNTRYSGETDFVYLYLPSLTDIVYLISAYCRIWF